MCLYQDQQDCWCEQCDKQTHYKRNSVTQSAHFFTRCCHLMNLSGRGHNANHRSIWGIFYETFSKFSCYLVSITVFSTELVLYSSEQYFTNGLHLHWWTLGTSLIEPTLKRYWKHFVKNFPPVSYLLATDVTPTCHH